jgi:hypothetical protein
VCQNDIHSSVKIYQEQSGYFVVQPRTYLVLFKKIQIYKMSDQRKESRRITIVGEH